MEGEAKGSTFKMKGHTLPGINQRSETKNMADGRSKSSVFQQDMVSTFPGGAGNIEQRRNIPPQGPMGAVTNPSMLVSKPSVAKDMKTGKYKQKFER